MQQLATLKEGTGARHKGHMLLPLQSLVAILSCGEWLKMPPGPAIPAWSMQQRRERATACVTDLQPDGAADEKAGGDDQQGQQHVQQQR